MEPYLCIRMHKDDTVHFLANCVPLIHWSTSGGDMQQCTGKGRKEEYFASKHIFKCTLRRANCNGVIMRFPVGKQAESVVYVLH